MSMDSHSMQSCSSSSSLPMMDEDNDYRQCLPQQQLETISVSGILTRDCEHNGFLYKRAQEKVTDQITELISPVFLSKWQLRYVILYHEYVLYYKNEQCSKPKGVFSLRGYNRVLRAEDMTSANQQWAFKIIGMRGNDRTWYFGAASEREMRLWMAYFKVTMEKAIHGKARDKSLKILNDLQYNERKYLTGGSGNQLSISASSFEPGIYEDIEEPLQDEADYLPPNPVSSKYFRQLPVPPRSVQHSPRPPVLVGRGPLPQPVLPPRPEQPVLPPRPESLDRRESTLSTTSIESGDYINPLEPDKEIIQQLRSQHGLQLRNTEPSPPRQFPPSPPQIPYSNTQRQGPEGNSFRKKPFVETPDIKDLRGALKPVVPFKPKLDAKPTVQAKPQTPLKPKPAPRVPAQKDPAFIIRPDRNQLPSQEPAIREPAMRVPAIREPAMRVPAVRKPAVIPSAVRDLLPASAQFDSADKRTAEGKLFQYSVDGMYLLRLSSGPGKVLMVYHMNLNLCKHYKVFGNEVDTFSLTTEPVFPDMQQLLQHYSTNSLPNHTFVKLSQPYPG